MKVLIVGSGGREHAIAWKTAQSRRVDKIYCAPGNAGISQVAECVDIKPMEFEKLVAFAKEKEIDLTVIGMDDPLVGGIVDAFLMKKYGIPTAAYETFTDPEAALAYLETAKMPIVLKADGLALGKGVLICQDLSEARAGVRELMMDKKFGSAGNEIVVEEFMTGFRPFLCGWKYSEDHELRPGPQAGQGRRPGIKHRRYGKLLPQPLLYEGGGRLLSGTYLPAYGGRHEGRRPSL